MTKRSTHKVIVGIGKSDELVVPKKQANNEASASAEFVEGRGSTEGKLQQSADSPTQSGIPIMSRVLQLRTIASRSRCEQFTSLYHLLNAELLTLSFYRLKRHAATGVDGLSWQEYETMLFQRILELEAKLVRGSYRPRAARRIFIPKADGSERPLSILCLEDKIVQQAIVTIMEQIYETDFMGFSYGFRPGRSQHEALDALYVGMLKRKVNWVLDLDIKKFFDQVNHDWLIKFIQHRIRDKRLIRLITQWIKVGWYDESGARVAAQEGVPQGGVISPLLANIYLHYCFDLWANQWRKHQGCGDVIVVRYADDSVLGFQRKCDAVKFLNDLKNRLYHFGLSLNENKTSLIRFGRFALSAYQQNGWGKPGTFDFLGFTHICSQRRHTKEFSLIRQTSSKRLRAVLQKVKAWLMRNRHKPIPEQINWLKLVMQGHMNYFAVPKNTLRIQCFHREIQKYWFKALKRRSQRFTLTWKNFGVSANKILPKVKVLHPYPNERFFVKYPK